MNEFVCEVMLPAVAEFLTCHIGDKKWIEDKIMTLPFSLRKIAVQKYSAVFKAEFERTNNEGMARREANSRLRAFVERVNGNEHSSDNR